MKHYIVLILSLSLIFVISACDAGGDDSSTTDMTSGGESAGGESSGGESAGGESAGGESAGGESAGGESAGGAMSTGTGSWGDECSSMADCSADSPMCVINPMMGPPGYCSKPCTSTTQCADTIEGWTCNVIGPCDSPSVSWCGPNEEIAAGGGVLVECP